MAITDVNVICSSNFTRSIESAFKKHFELEYTLVFRTNISFKHLFYRVSHEGIESPGSFWKGSVAQKHSVSGTNLCYHMGGNASMLCASLVTWLGTPDWRCVQSMLPIKSYSQQEEA